MSSPANITRLLEDASAGHTDAEDALFRSVYEELRRIAKAHRRRWRGNDTVSTTVLVNEAYLKLAGGGIKSYNDRSHFFATASKAMRQVLVTYAERLQAQKRGSGGLRVTLAGNLPAAGDAVDWLLTIDELLKQLENSSERQCRIVECRLFGGMTVEDTAAALDISPRTVKREWALASAWLYREMGVDE